MKKYIYIIAGLFLLTGCFKDSTEYYEEIPAWGYVNTFARNMMNIYYLWQDDISEKLDPANWSANENPIEKIKEIKYRDDYWTMLTDDFDSFYSSVSGVETTCGLEFKLYVYGDNNSDRLCGVVTYTYENSPARNAGLKRGDVFLKIDGKELTMDNYADIIYGTIYGGKTSTLEMGDGRSVILTPVKMYENPVHTYKVIDLGVKKIGYLHYTSFTLDSCAELVEVGRLFREEGISELVLDLRYNGGGYVITSELLASMLAPEEVVKKGSVLSTMVYNKALTEYFESKGEDTNSYFKITHSYTDDSSHSVSYSTEGANMGINKIYALVTGNSASASESLLCSLYPYIDIVTIGQKTHGKYCSGLMMAAEDFYTTYSEQLGKEYSATGLKKTENWGLYVMFGRFADKDGKTRCMPDGIYPDIEVIDNPSEAYPLGDTRERLLSAAISLSQGIILESTKVSVGTKEIPAVDFHRPGFGVYIANQPIR